MRVKMHALLLFALGLASAAAAPNNINRIVGGSETTIERYPFSAVMLSSSSGILYIHNCGSTILNNRSVLSAAHCFGTHAASRFRVRVGSTSSNSGGSVHNANRVLIHPNYRRQTKDSDIAIVRVASNFRFTNSVRAGSIAGANYNLPDNSVVWAIGWGATSFNGPTSPRLRHVQIWTVNQATCRSRYSGRTTITENMLCSGHLDVGGRDQCQGDSGSPLLHNNIAVGLSSFGNRCALPRYPGVNVRISRFSSWIQNNS